MLEHVASRMSTASQASYTFDDVPLGEASADRYILVAVSGGRFNTPDIATIGVTVAGASTGEVSRVNASRSMATIRMTTSPLPADSTGQVVVTFNAAPLGCKVDLWAITELASAAPHDTGGQSAGAGPISASIDVPPGGVAVAAGWGARSLGGNDIRGGCADSEFPAGAAAHVVALNNPSGDLVWTGLTERSDAQLSTGFITASVMMCAASFELVTARPRVFGAVMG